jgi:hypothetical protein
LQLYALQSLAGLLVACPEMTSDVVRAFETHEKLSVEAACAIVLDGLESERTLTAAMYDICLRLLQGIVRLESRRARVVLDQVLSDALRVANTPDLRQLLTVHCNLDNVGEFLRSPRLVTDTEDTVAYLVDTWLGAHDPSGELGYKKTLAAHLYIPCISQLYFAYMLGPADWMIAERIGSTEFRDLYQFARQERGKTSFPLPVPKVTVTAVVRACTGGTVVVSGLKLCVSVLVGEPHSEAEDSAEKDSMGSKDSITVRLHATCLLGRPALYSGAIEVNGVSVATLRRVAAQQDESYCKIIARLPGSVVCEDESITIAWVNPCVSL